MQDNKPTTIDEILRQKIDKIAKEWQKKMDKEDVKWEKKIKKADDPIMMEQMRNKALFQLAMQYAKELWEKLQNELAPYMGRTAQGGEIL